MKKILAFVTALLMLPILSGCGGQEQSKQSQGEILENTTGAESIELQVETLENITEAELIKLQALAISVEHPEGGAFSLNSVKESQWNPVLEILSHDEASNTYTVKVNPVLQYGFKQFVVTQEELDAILSWQEINGKQVLFPLLEKNSGTIIGRKDFNCWYNVSADGLPLDDNDQPIPYSMDMIPVANYLFDKEGNICYYRPMGAVDTFEIRVLVVNFYQFIYGEELSFPFNELECSFLGIRYLK